MNTWDELRPREDENIYIPDSLINYYSRNNYKYSHIPKEVFEQWIIPLHQDKHTLKNYSWIEFDKIKISCQLFSNEELLRLNIIEDFKKFFLGRSLNKGFDSFACTKEDLEYWKKEGTWRIPPIVIDTKKFEDKPIDSEINGIYQLVEGHNRIGYFYAINKFSKKTLKKKHKVYIITK